MTPSARVQAAIEVLDAWKAGTPAEVALTRWARGARYAGSKDRAAVRDHVYDLLRRKGEVEALGFDDGGRGWMLGLLRLQDDDAGALFSEGRHGPEPLTDVEAALLARPRSTPDPALNIPDWVRAMLSDDHGPDSSGLWTALSARASVYLRVNIAKTSRDAARVALEQEGITAHPDPGVPTALRVTEGARRVRASEVYTSGLVELQDLSAQAAVLACPWPKTGQILDYCAGGGGKTLALAPLTQAKLFAHDANPRRMADLPARAARAGVRVEVLVTEQTRQRAPFDAVLCDVPCSGSGTWRRDPEAKWRLTPEKLADLIKTQAEILDAAATLTAPGGILCYMTCSLLSCENDGQISTFLERHPNWRKRSAEQQTPMTASDGFYHCVLECAKAS